MGYIVRYRLSPYIFLSCPPTFKRGAEERQSEISALTHIVAFVTASSRVMSSMTF